MKLFSKRGAVIISLLALFAVALSVVLLVKTGPFASASMNVESDGESVKIFIGEMGNAAPRGYLEKRTDFLNELSQVSPDNTYSAVVSLDNNYTEEELNTFVITHGLNLERIYMWVPGETGKLSLAVENNDIKAAKESFIIKMDGPLGASAEVQNRLQDLMEGSLRVYAITVSGTAQSLRDLSELESIVAAVDLKYNPDAEAYANNRGLKFSYVELPTKPDGFY